MLVTDYAIEIEEGHFLFRVETIAIVVAVQ